MHPVSQARQRNFAACGAFTFRAIVPMESPSMTVCPHTGLTIPECSCSVCLEAQMRRHRPNGTEAEVSITRRARVEQRRTNEHRAA
jgi:hypothetical protein